MKIKSCISLASLLLICVTIIKISDGHDNTKLEILRERVHRLEERLMEDISLLRKEFYHEIKAASASDGVGVGETTTGLEDTTERPSTVESMEKQIQKLQNLFQEKIGFIQFGFAEEKRIRRDIQQSVQDLQNCQEGLVKTLGDMSRNVNNTMSRLHVKNELRELIDLLKEIKTHLQKDKDIVVTSASSEKSRDCSDWQRRGHSTSGVYTLHADMLWRPLQVWCDMDTAGGGWTVFQRRKDGSENFNRKWIDYMFGFGNISGEFWLGNEFLHRLTAASPQRLRIELEDFEGDRRFAEYGIFNLGSVSEGYQLHVEFITGNVTDSLIDAHNGKQFSTSDRGPSSSCSKTYKGGWWYGSCHAVNINGLYLKGNHSSYADGINWYHWRGHHYSLKFTEMKYKPY